MPHGYSSLPASYVVQVFVGTQLEVDVRVLLHARLAGLRVQATSSNRRKKNWLAALAALDPSVSWLLVSIHGSFMAGWLLASYSTLQHATTAMHDE